MSGTLTACLCAVLAACTGTGMHADSASSLTLSANASDKLPPKTSVSERMFRQTGISGWYGIGYHGRAASPGETADANDLTAAHRILPLGKAVGVTNLDNSKSIVVTVTRRGPLAPDRIIDLSFDAARALGFSAQGTARVSIEAPEAHGADGAYTVLAANYVEENNARMLKERLSKRFSSITIVPYETDIARFYRVCIGSYDSEERAEQVAGKLTLEGLEPVVIRKD